VLTLTASLSDWLIGDGTIPALTVGDELPTLLSLLPDSPTLDEPTAQVNGWDRVRPGDELCCDYTVTGELSFVDQHQYGGVAVLDVDDIPVCLPLGPMRAMRIGERVGATGRLVIDPYYWWTLIQIDDRDRIYDESQRCWLVRKIWGARRGPDDPAEPSRLVLEPFEPIDKIPREYVGGRQDMPTFLLELELLDI
jgi:hypothetical protein